MKYNNNMILLFQVRREQLRKTGEKLSEDLALYVTRRETAMEKNRAAAAVEKAHGTAQTSQSTYHHKLRLAKADVARATKVQEIFFSYSRKNIWYIFIK